jgi:hypothetical protein
MSYKDILNVVPVLNSANLVSNLSKKKKKKGILGDATDIFIGVPLIKVESDLIAGL